MKGFVHYFISIIFSVFGIVQCNDPDFYIWMPPYFLVAFVAFSAARSNYYAQLCKLLSIVFLIWMATYLPEFIDWINDGLPSITNSMKAESPYIEFVRESMGLLLCFTAMAYYYWLAKKKT